MLLNQVGKHLLLLLQLVNNEQTRSNIIERLKRHQAALNDQIESEKFCQLDSSSVSPHSRTPATSYLRAHQFLSLVDLFFETDWPSVSHVGLPSSNHDTGNDIPRSSDQSCLFIERLQ